MRRAILPFTLALLPATALAGEVALPLGWVWCSDRPSVEATLAAPHELTDGVVEAEASVFGVRGTVTAVFEEDLLVEARFRCFDDDKHLAAVEGALTKAHGAGVKKDRSKEGLARSFSRDWEIDAEQELALRVGSEQIKVSWIVPATRCVAEQERRKGLSDAEQADLDATAKKPAIAFDPYSEDIEAVEARKKAADDAKKSEEKKAEETKKEDEPPPKDGDIDW